MWGIDTPEIRGKCEIEKRKAIEASGILQARLFAASRIDLLHAGRGKYFRVVAVVVADGVDVGRKLIGRGPAWPIATRYPGSRRIFRLPRLPDTAHS